MKNEMMIINEENIKNKIYKIRGKEVMLDADLAEIYGYTTKAFNQQVSRNIERFDENFMFQLTELEYESLRSQIVTLEKSGRGRHTKYLPYVFTEQGIYMLMTVLKGELAIRQSKALILIFKKMKDYIINNTNLISYDNIINIALQTENNTKDIENIKNDLKNIHNMLDHSYDKEILILNGEYVESNLAYKKIYSLAKKSIYIVDDYIDLKTLVLLKEIKNNVNVTIFSDNINKKLHKIEFDDFVKEYPNVKINFKKPNNKYHDRYIILDYKMKDEKIFHCGASSKDSGNKITTISEINDRNIYSKIIDNLINNDELLLA